MKHLADRINSILDSHNGDFLSRQDARYQLHVMGQDIELLIEEYKKAITVTQSALNNSTTQRDLHSNAIDGYKKQLADLVKMKEDVAAALTAILPS